MASNKGKLIGTAVGMGAKYLKDNPEVAAEIVKSLRNMAKGAQETVEETEELLRGEHGEDDAFSPEGERGLLLIGAVAVVLIGIGFKLGRKF